MRILLATLFSGPAATATAFAHAGHSADHVTGWLAPMVIIAMFVTCAFAIKALAGR